MAVGVNGHWKMPIGYFLVAGLNGTERNNLLKQCLILMGDTGAKVHSITFDGAYSNGKMCSNFGASFDKNDELSFIFENPYNNEPIYIFYDACHMIKLIRNTLGDMGCLFQEGEKISWDHIKMLYFKEKNKGLKAATKLTNKHVYYYNEKMNVKLATQVLSNSVGNGLKFCKSIGCDDFKDIDATAEFCFLMNNGNILKIPTAWHSMKNNLKNMKILARSFMIMYQIYGCPMVKKL
jgi:hypothetical protein